MRFSDFEIRGWQLDETHVQVIVHNSPAGYMRKPVTVHFEPDRLGILCSTFEQSSWYVGSSLSKNLLLLGQSLAELLLPRPVQALLASSLQRIAAGDGLRIRLCLDGPLVDLPWEYLTLSDSHDTESPAEFLCLDPRISVVREPAATSIKASPSDREQRMVFAGMLWSNGQKHWRVEEEYEELARTLEPAKKGMSVHLTTADKDHIPMALLKPALVFHYAGHTYSEESHGYLVREVRGQQPIDLIYISDLASVDCDSLSSESLATMLQRAKTRLALFSAANSGRWAFVEPLLRAGIPAVIGTQGLTSSKALAAFCDKLYSDLDVGLSLDEAVNSARLRVVDVAHSSGQMNYEWGAFMVYMPSQEPVLLPRPDDRSVRRDQAEARRERQTSIDRTSGLRGDVLPRWQRVDTRKLKEDLVDAFNEEELAELCENLQAALEEDRIEYQLGLEVVGGDNLPDRAGRLIGWSERRGVLPYLVEAAIAARPLKFKDYR